MSWREKYQDKIMSVEDAVRIVESGDKVMIQQAHGEAKTILRALVDRAPELRDVTIMSHLHWGPADYASPDLAKSFRGWSCFLSGSNRAEYNAGRIDFQPMFFYEMVDFYKEINTPDVFIMQAPPPDEHGMCSYGLNADYSVACVEKAKKLIVQINPAIPFTYGSAFSLSKATAIVDLEEPLVEVPGSDFGEVERKMGEYIAELVHDGDTLQMGIGGVPNAILAALKDKKDLGIHTELFSDGVVDLYNAGVITNAQKTYHTGKFVSNFLMGTQKLFDFVDHNPNVLLLPVDQTNDPYLISLNDNMVSINACLQVDLLGQVVSDSINGKQYSGPGGQVDFVRGAKRSNGGKSILVLKSTAKKGTISSIVPQLPQGAIVTVSRCDVQYICTEYGVVNLFGKTNRERAELLISIAHPDFREELTQQAQELGLL